MSNIKDEIVQELNGLTKHRIELDARQRQLTDRLAADIAQLKTAAEGELTALATELATTDGQIWNIVDEHQDDLIAKGKRSFALLYGVYRLRTIDSHLRVADKAAAFETARSLGVVRKVAKLTVKWQLIQEKLLSWLKHHPEAMPSFLDSLEQTPETTTLYLQTNDGTVAIHSAERISPVPAKITPIA